MVIKLGLNSDQYIHNSILAMYASCGQVAAASQLFNNCLSFDVVPWNAMILGFAKIGLIDSSRCLFDEMPTRTVITWSSMISGYVRNERSHEAFDLFYQMQSRGLKPNEHIMVSLLGACSNSGALKQGKWIHSFIKKMKISSNPIVITVGSIDDALEVFEIASVKSLSSWNSVIIGLATHSRGKAAIQLFTKLQNSSGLKARQC
ncbi:Pentatricopeptide repeat-containing protein [Dendrobium catenatum]|uniref:Pentatricopeptide repeat-containing protein n=1 Tax=Dendrobium catenatum TaxID=906689 RepID=A0A2I0XEC8_9ASPA|nr:Pentatricopeptide repeat-containing protein [Dendrobium catenatum]